MAHVHARSLPLGGLTPLPSADAIVENLFSPGPRYLLGSFTASSRNREIELGEAADWYGLATAMTLAGVSEELDQSATHRWIALLKVCAEKLDARERQEARALIAALQAASDAADERDRKGTKLPNVADIWTSMATALAGTLHPSTDTTLRTRRWYELRTQLGRVLAGLRGSTIDARGLPRPAATPSLFGDADYLRVWNALQHPRNGGLAVIAGPSGHGKTELALSYAEAYSDRYEHRTFWLRAGDSAQLEVDFLDMARRLLGVDGPPTELRREAFRILETTDRWLMICDGVRDPRRLLPLLPRNPNGHVLCTQSASAQPDEWSRCFDADVDQTPLIKRLEVPFVADFLVRDSSRSTKEVESIARRVRASRLAVVLARKWFDVTDGSAAEYEARWRSHATPVTSDAVVAAKILIECVESGDQVDRDAVELLRRLIPYGTTRFPVSILIHSGSATGADDPRLDRLTSLELAKHVDRGSDHARFTVYSPVLQAVGADPSDERLAIASRTVLAVFPSPQPHRPRQSEMDLLPSAEVLAEAEAKADTRPLVAVELYARAAMCHLNIERVRPAERLFERMTDCVSTHDERIARTLAEQDEEWPDVGDAITFRSPVRRISDLIGQIRLAGHPAGARDLYGAILRVANPKLNRQRWPKVIPGPPADVTGPEWANVLLEGALALRDLDDDEPALASAERAEQIWRDDKTIDEDRRKRGLAAALSVQGHVLVQLGRTPEAVERSEEAMKLRLARCDTPGASRDAFGELARGRYLEGRIAYLRGNIQDAARAYRDSADGWRKAGAEGPTETTDIACPRRINLISAQSHHAQMQAILGHHREAQEEALDSLRDARREYPRAHREHRVTSVIMANTAYVLRLGGLVAQARDLAIESLAMCERLWTPTSTRTTFVRRYAAQCMLDAGLSRRAYNELAQILELHRERKHAAHRPGARTAHARALADLGRWLVKNSLFIHPDAGADAVDEQLLDLAEDAIGAAIMMFRGEGDPPPGHPEYADALSNRAEIAIRRKDDGAVALAQQAHDVWASIVTRDARLLAARSRILRARIQSDVPLDELLAESTRLADALQSLTQHTTADDRLEVGLVMTSIARRRWVENGRDPTKAEAIYSAARVSLIDDGVAGMHAQVGHERHHLVARAHAELALLASELQLPARRGRSERERDRYRPELESTISTSIARLLPQ